MVSIGLDNNPRDKFLVYSMDGCPYCVKAIELLTSMSIPFTVYKLNVHYTKETLREKCGMSPVDRLTVPQVFYNDKRIGGYDDLCKYMENLAGGFADSFR